jgi:hypothetical protein|tara:strand:+ start:16785 stop:17339 length:555 start_codon:yes stop_codon:yes gene_type:complete
VTNYEAILEEFARETTLAAKRELGSRRIGRNRSYGVATRELQKSLRFNIKGSRISFGSPLDYAGFVHWGVNGTNRSRSAPYSYKFPNPSEKHVQAIRQWMRDKPVRLQKPGGKGFARQTEAALQSAAYLIARAIKRNGVPGVKYWTEAYDTMWPRYAQKIAEAKAEDVALEIAANIGGITIKAK